MGQVSRFMAEGVSDSLNISSNTIARLGLCLSSQTNPPATCPPDRAYPCPDIRRNQISRQHSTT